MGTAVLARTMLALTAAVVLLTGGCGPAGPSGEAGGHDRPSRTADPAAARQTRMPEAGRHARTLPGVGDALHARVPATSRQVVTVHGRGAGSADATVAFHTRRGNTWHTVRTWPAHNGKRGWTTDHREGDKRSPVGVFELSDAGGVLPAPQGTRLPYHRSDAFAAPRYWPKTHWHDFDLVIAIDYNRVPGRSPADPTRPRGQDKGGSIWLHLDHGSGTSGCVSVSPSAMRYLLRTLDPAANPVIVMGDARNLAR